MIFKKLAKANHLDKAALMAVLDRVGYTVTGVRTQPCEKTGFSLFRR